MPADRLETQIECQTRRLARDVSCQHQALLRILMCGLREFRHKQQRGGEIDIFLPRICEHARQVRGSIGRAKAWCRDVAQHRVVPGPVGVTQRLQRRADEIEILRRKIRCDCTGDPPGELIYR